jgi:hypothetical protein
MRAYVFTKQRTWDITLPMGEFAINNTQSEATRQSPFLLNYGINPWHPCIAQLGSPQHDIADLAVSHPVLLDIMAVTLGNVPDIHAAALFADYMQLATVHTKTMLQAARSCMQQQEKGKRTQRVPFQEGDMVMFSTKYINLL